ncbi:MAG: hypothetical protein A2X46_06700 [Lentisphaerae bacterium GWF2_57_35]|nr:MAG: hypothetical protein A2X46_06700 [Lentisphaerae bacterium GWF2_57_35]
MRKNVSAIVKRSIGLCNYNRGSSGAGKDGAIMYNNEMTEIELDLNELEGGSGEQLTTLPEETGFIWGVGIEGSCIPHLNIDQYEWTQHNRFWKEDLKLVKEELGLSHIRYSIPWHYSEPSRGKFDWSQADERIGYCIDLGLQPIMDVMHFGTPVWLPLAVGDPEFPEALEQFTEAMVQRYRKDIATWCPINEPLVTSLFSGDFGFWPPHSRKWTGYFPVLSRVAMGTSRAIRAIRHVQPEGKIVVCDAADHFQTLDESLAEEVTRRNLRRFLLLDLISGAVDSEHPLYDWITAYGITPLDLQWFRTHPQMPDLIGLDYYSHSDWRLERSHDAIRQRQAESPAGLYGVATEYYNRYARPMLVTETSIDGMPINRRIWLERLVDDSRRLRQNGIPLLGMIWWPLFDHIDWDGALTHQIGKLHQVGIFRLVRQQNGNLVRTPTALVSIYSKLARQGVIPVGSLSRQEIVMPPEQEQRVMTADKRAQEYAFKATPQALPSAKPAAEENIPLSPTIAQPTPAFSDGCGILVFSHLRWGFVWQRPQQFLSRFAVKNPVLFVEEPFFDRPQGDEPRMEMHRVMANVTVACPHMPPSWAQNPELPETLRRLTHWALDQVNQGGSFDRPLLWYYNPMDAIWSLGHFKHAGIVYDCMDELSKFSGASQKLVDVEQWLMSYADVVFAGGPRLGQKKAEQHNNVHAFGCGVEAEHFEQAMEPAVTIPPDIDFIPRPIFGWFGVIDERVDYHLVGELARMRPDWSFAMIGPVVKVDPNLLPHSPNLFWLGGRGYDVLPNYCKAFDVCMMCFAINEATEYINPTKALEYLATGRPVISTPVTEVVQQYSDLVDIVSTPEEFVATAERLIESPDQERIRKGIAKAKDSTWEATVLKMHAIIVQGVSHENRRSKAEIKPMMGLETLDYRYVSVQGS